ncbi:MAG TPA: extracellular solute-binding protein, partial [Vicinamibacterales bacterium]|nr:extracellular solute-binding protein [Vicinamibacterales bacterium]
MLRVALVGGPMYDRLYGAIPQFERAHNIRVEIVAKLPHPELNAFVKQAFESGIELDAIATHTKYAPSQAHWLRPLDDLLSAELVRDLLPRPAELSRIDGRLMQVPRNLDVRLLHYRRDLIDRPPATWDDLLQAAVNLTSKHTTTAKPFYGFLFPGRESGLFGMFYELLAAAGGQLFDAELRPAFDAAPGRWAVDQIVAMHRHHRITPRDLATWHYDEISASFRGGHAAMVSDWPGSYHLYRDPATCAVADRVGLALLPKGPAGIRAAYAGCHSFAITRTARHPDGAAALIAHLTSFESQLGEARQGAIPCRRSALAEVRSEAAGDAAAATRWALLAETETTMIIPPRFAAYPLCEDAIWRNVQRAMLGELPAADAV